jgi:hypothetical protein
MNASDEAYSRLPKLSTHTLGIGGALISMVEPHPGQELAYNRWYEDDHYYSGALYMPWMYSGRRFVATRDLQEMRYPAVSPIAQPITAGCYLHLYWITPGHMEDQVRWSVSTNEVLRATDRIHLARTHVYTSFQDWVGSHHRDTHGPKDYQVLDHGSAGVVMEVLDGTVEGGRDALDAWVRSDYLPWLHRSPDNPITATVWFAPQPLPADKMPDVADIPGVDRRLTLLHFLDTDPRLCWDIYFAGNGGLVAAGGAGTLEFAAPFIPVEFGTDRYVDELR